MSLKSGSMTLLSQWVATKTVTGFSNATQQSALKKTITFNGVTVDQVKIGTVTIAGSGTSTISLRTGTDPAGDTILMSKACAMECYGTGAAWKLEIHGTNGLDAWFLQGTTAPRLVFPDGGAFAAFWPSTALCTVDATHCQLLVTNTGATSLTFSYVIYGGT